MNRVTCPAWAVLCWCGFICEGPEGSIVAALAHQRTHLSARDVITLVEPSLQICPRCHWTEFMRRYGGGRRCTNCDYVDEAAS